jgi:hypothetical protein
MYPLDQLLFMAHPFVYTLPLLIRLRPYPHTVAHIVLGIIALFNPYPCMGDMAFVMVSGLQV